MHNEYPSALGDPKDSRHFVYFSTAKADSFDCTQDKRAKDFGLGVLPVNINAALGGTPLTKTQKANRILEHLQTSGLISYDHGPIEEYLLTDAILQCGTMWPFAGKTEEMRTTAWWFGHGETIQILAYGHIKHLTDQGSVPTDTIESTWWPSRADTYIRILEALTEATDSEAPLTDILPVANFSGIVTACFNEGVRRGQPISERKLYTILLRIDQIEPSKGGQTTVYGSPVWIERNRSLRTGVYFTRNLDNEIDGSGLWDGNKWLNFTDKTGLAVPFRANVPGPRNSDIRSISTISSFPTYDYGDRLEEPPRNNGDDANNAGFFEKIIQKIRQWK